MAYNNSIALAEKYVPLLDEVYKNAALTADLDGAPELVQQGANANELIIPKMSMDGLADYSRNGGYVDGDVNLTNETVQCNFDRGRMFQVDNMDNEETAGIAFGRLAGEFIRTKVVPELDAFRLAAYASASGISKVETPAALATGVDPDQHQYLQDVVIQDLGLVQDMDTTKSKEVLARFSKIVQVPQTRFYTAITQKDGKTEGQTGGGYARKENSQEFTATTSQTDFTVTAKPTEIQKVTVNGEAVTTGFTYTAATGVLAFGTAPGNGKTVVVTYDTGCEQNFLVIQKSAVIQFQKHVAPKIITPEQNQSADAWKYGYRNVGIAEVYENKVAGIYSHYKPA